MPPVYRDQALREGRIRGVVVDLDNVDLGLSGGRLDREREELRIRCRAVQAERTERRSMTLEGLADIPRLGE
ncbi:hypothetical protein SLS60_009673 [Paraconiothyrium brasiliense]|uniref:Uncharacterized protein n=1 Tax=Paraconiothyrium brasiliense TaxID=300254 RepID=A0ABR3QVF3_9PLEO